MKITKIAGICKKNKAVVLFDKPERGGETVRQYIGDGGAIFPISGLPYLDEESVFTIFDIPEKAREGWYFHSVEFPEQYNIDDTDDHEQHIEMEGLAVVYAGKTLKPLQTSRGLVFIETRYLAPMIDVLDVLELYERQTASGQTYIVAKAGFLLQALIMPYNAITEKFTERLEGLARSCRKAFEATESRRKAEQEREQTQAALFNYDPATGEVIEESEAAGNE